jgi:hypothetical protein
MQRNKGLPSRDLRLGSNVMTHLAIKLPGTSVYSAVRKFGLWIALQ